MKASVKITNLKSGKTFTKTPDEVKDIIEHPLLKGKYAVEKTVETPPEVSGSDKKTEKPKTGAAAGNQDDVIND